MLEGETEESLNRQLKLFHKRALPDLGNNIKCGNSLIESDFYQVQQMLLIDDEERYRVNAFDWHIEFKNIFQAGGFDIVIGNPPWGATFTEADLAYLRVKHRRVVARTVDSFIYFIDKATQLLKENGRLGFIVPSTVLNQVDAAPVRDLMLKRGLSVLINLGQGIFGRKVLNTSTIIISSPQNERAVIDVQDLSLLKLFERKTRLTKQSATPLREWEKIVKRDPHLTFFVGNASNAELLDRLRNEHPSFGKILAGTIQRGVSPDVVSAHVISKLDSKIARLEPEILKPSVSEPQIKRYRPWTSDQLIVYTERSTAIDMFPRTLNHLTKFKHLNTCKEVIAGKHPWWALHRPRDFAIFKSPKFIGLTTAKTIELIYDADSSVYVTDAMYVFSLLPEYDPWACMAILQSKLFLFLYRVSNQGESRVIPQIKASKLLPLPFPNRDRTPAIWATLSQYCEIMIRLNQELSSAKVGQDRTNLKRQIETIEQRIDDEVYRIYGLTEDEINTLEGISFFTKAAECT